jgi:hypothetical protein
MEQGFSLNEHEHEPKQHLTVAAALVASAGV